MIVQSMNGLEVYSEIMKDYKCIKKRIANEGIFLQKAMLRKKLKKESRCINYITPTRNNWTIIFQIEPYSIKTSYYLRTFDKKGPGIYTLQFMYDENEVTDLFLLKYSYHFFERYNERMHLNLTDGKKIINHFLKNNFHCNRAQSDILLEDIRYNHYVFKDGIGLGWSKETKKIIFMKTFITNEMLTKHQKILNSQIKNCLEDCFIYKNIKFKHLKRAISD